MSFRRLDPSKVDMEKWERYLIEMRELKSKMKSAARQSDDSVETVIEIELAKKLTELQSNFNELFDSWKK